MNCPNAQDWDLLATETLDEGAAAPLLHHLKECPDCRGLFERARRAHLDRIRMYDQFDRGHDSLREQLMAALPPAPLRSRADRLVRGWRYMGDLAMSFRQKVGARAMVGVVSAAACIGFIAFLVTTLSKPPSAFAAAIQRFQSARTIVCRISSSITGGPMAMQQTGRFEVSADYGSRCEMGLGGTAPMLIQYTPLEGSVTTVTPLSRTYMVVDIQTVGGHGHGAQGANSLDAFIRLLSKLQGQATRELGRKTVDGLDALGYEISGELLGLGSAEGVRSELWVDARTNLPVRYVAEMPAPQPGGTLQLVYDQFEWDTPLDPTRFVPDIPADYTRLEATAPAPDEAALIRGLGNYAEMTGKYPPALNAATIATDFAAAIGSRIASAMVRGEKAPDQQTLMQKSLDIGSGIAFYQNLLRESRSPEYYGKTVLPGHGDAVLVRWRLSSGQWRVIYGDLRTETRQQEDRPDKQ